MRVCYRALAAAFFRLECGTALLLLLTLAALPARSLDNRKTLAQYAHRIWGQEEGLFQPTIYSILQTHDGFLWLGTQDSLIRFDGLQFREFDAGGAAAFHDTLIRSLLEDKDRNLWIGSIGAGLGRVAPNGALTHFTLANGLPSDNIFCLDSASGGGLWVCTDQGLSHLANGRFRTYTTADGLPSNQIRSTCATNGTRWVANLDFGLATWDGRRFHQYLSKLLTATDKVTALACGVDGTVWAGTNNGLLQIKGAESRLLTMRDGLPDVAVSSLLASSDGSLWVGTNDGITRIRGDRFSVYRTRDGLSHSLVLSLYIDREGTLWAGTKDGLDQFTDGNVTPYTTNEGLLSNETGPVLEDRAGRLYIGTLGWGLNIFENGKFRALTKKDGLLDDTVFALELDRTGDLWIGTRRGLNRLHDGRVTGSYTAREGIFGSEIHALFEDPQGALWIGTEKGVTRFEHDRFSTSSLGPAATGDQVLALAGGRTVRVFASTDGPGFYTLRDGPFASYPLGITRPVDCFFLDHVHHTAWMGTLGSGLLRWQNSNIARVRVKDGLYDNRIYQILDDGRGNFWMASSKGIFRVSRSELEALADGKLRSVNSMPFSTGQLRFECRAGVQPAACRTRDGRLWFSTTSGLVVVDPGHLTDNLVPPPVQITGVLVNGERMGLSRPLDLKPNQSNLEIRYAGLSFVSPEKVTFKYKLDGFDKSWTEAGSRREAFFTNLPPKRFKFLVYATAASGATSASPAVLEFRVEPKLYQRVWFFPLLAFLIALLAVAIYRMRVNHLRQRFDLILAERSRIARELHDTLLQGLSGITMQLQALWMRMPASKEKQFLAEIIEDAGACSQEARQSLWGLRARGPRTKEFSDKLIQVCREVLEESDISLKLDVQPVGLQALPDTEYQLLRIAREVVSNTLAHAHATVLHVYLAIHKGSLNLSFEDNGVGFVAENGVQLLDHFGLVGIRERAEEIGAELKLSSSPGAGTKITIHLPLTKARTTESNPEPGVEHQIR